MLIRTSEVNNKKILFYGPAPTEDKKTLDINNFDLIIITNEMVHMFFKKYERVIPRVILLANSFFCRNHYRKIAENSENLSGVWVKGADSYKKVCKAGVRNAAIIETKVESMEEPLGLNIVLNHLKLQNPRKLNMYLYITGVTFYSDLYSTYEDGYQLVKKNGMSHDIKKNIDHFKQFVKEGYARVETCDELKKILEVS